MANWYSSNSPTYSIIHLISVFTNNMSTKNKLSALEVIRNENIRLNSEFLRLLGLTTESEPTALTFAADDSPDSHPSSNQQHKKVLSQCSNNLENAGNVFQKNKFPARNEQIDSICSFLRQVLFTVILDVLPS